MSGRSITRRGALALAASALACSALTGCAGDWSSLLPPEETTKAQDELAHDGRVYQKVPQPQVDGAEVVPFGEERVLSNPVPGQPQPDGSYRMHGDWVGSLGVTVTGARYYTSYEEALDAEGFEESQYSHNVDNARNVLGKTACLVVDLLVRNVDAVGPFATSYEVFDMYAANMEDPPQPDHLFSSNSFQHLPTNGLECNHVAWRGCLLDRGYDYFGKYFEVLPGETAALTFAWLVPPNIEPSDLYIHVDPVADSMPNPTVAFDLGLGREDNSPAGEATSDESPERPSE